MLKDNKNKFDDNVYDILKNAMYNMLISSFSKTGDELIDSYSENKIDKMSKNMAETFADLAAKPLTDAIEEHIKSSGLFINILPAGIALTSPVGPCTGTITITPQTAEIQIQ